jgi:hypothetical protein
MKPEKAEGAGTGLSRKTLKESVKKLQVYGKQREIMGKRTRY